MPELVAVGDLDAAIGSDAFDAVVAVAPAMRKAGSDALRQAAEAVAAVDKTVDEKARVVPAEGVAGGRLVLSPTGKLAADHDDVRRFADAASAGLQMARDAGAKKPLLVVSGAPDDDDFANVHAVSVLGAVQGLWEPLEARESNEDSEPVEQIGVALGDEDLAWVRAAEAGRRLARDLGGTEPERMAPPRFAEYCQEAFAGTSASCNVVSDNLEQDYPLLSAVARASIPIDRHRPRVVRLEYSHGTPTQTIFLAGKGVTYDTGGADIKAGGAMAGMSRDKGGGAAVAGFVRAVAELAPSNIRVVAEIGAVRNSVGADSFVTDEIITSHADVRVRIGNTDAEGRLVLADLLSHLRQQAKSATAPRIFSLATLTGHAVRAVGPYSIALDNRAARKAGVAVSLAEAGDAWGDPFELSRLRREDWDFVKPRSKADQVLSCNNAPSSGTARGHQFPMAFLAIASGLADHSHRDSDKPIAYTHIDIAGSATEKGDWQHGRPTGAPVVAMLRALL